MLKLLQGFKDFIMRGNVVDLAVGIVIGAAFTALVGSFTDAFIRPLIKLIGGGGSLGGTSTVNGVVFDWAGFINALVTFVLTAAVLYFLVVTPLNRLAERRNRGQEPESKAPAEDILLLREIRDALLANQRLDGTAAAAEAKPAQPAPARARTTPEQVAPKAREPE